MNSAAKHPTHHARGVGNGDCGRREILQRAPAEAMKDEPKIEAASVV